MRGGQVQTQTQAKTQPAAKTAPAPTQREAAQKQDHLVSGAPARQLQESSVLEEEGDRSALAPLAQLSELEDAQAAQDHQALARSTRDLLDAPAPQTAGLSQELLVQLTQALGLGAIPLIHGPEAASTLSGSKGRMLGGKVYLHQDFDPASPQGRELLAHEVVHVAQDKLRAQDRPDAGLKAEREAQELAQEFAATGRMRRPKYGLPAGHLAADDGLQLALATYKSGLETANSNVPDPRPLAVGQPQTGGKENRASKVKRYRNGVDGIADKIGRTEPFERLCDNIDEGPAAYAGALRDLENNEHFRKLSEMWQGAKDGGPDAGVMKRTFDHEFDGRGFWGSTERAFSLVARRAKALAKRKAEAKEASKAAESANGKGDAKVIEPTKIDPPGKGSAKAMAKAGKADAQLEELMNKPVQKDLPPLPGLKDFEAVSDERLSAMIWEQTHQQGLSLGGEAGLEQGRGRLILEQLTTNFVGSFGKNATDQFLDSAVYDTAGKLGDKALTAVTKGKFKAPFIGPAIGLYKMIDPKKSAGENVISAFGGDQLGKAGEEFSKVSAHLDAIDLSDGLGLDDFGNMLAVVADVMGGIANVLEAAQTILGTLSTIAYVVGGILIAVGLALVWLGVGAGLLAAGGWLIKAGGILGRINTVLGPIATAFVTLALLFRTAAAFLVPADQFAEELKGVGSAADKFGEKAGKKVGDKYGAKVSEGAMKAGAQAKNKASDIKGKIKTEMGLGEPSGQKAAQNVKQQVQAEHAQMKAKGDQALAGGKKNKQEQTKKKGLFAATKKVLGDEAKAMGENRAKKKAAKKEAKAKKPKTSFGQKLGNTALAVGKGSLSVAKGSFNAMLGDGASAVHKNVIKPAWKHKGALLTPRATLGKVRASLGKTLTEVRAAARLMSASGLEEIGLADTYKNAKNSKQVIQQAQVRLKQLDDQLTQLDGQLKTSGLPTSHKVYHHWEKLKARAGKAIAKKRADLATWADNSERMQKAGTRVAKPKFDDLAKHKQSQKDAQGLEKKKAELEQQIADAKKKVEEAEAAKAKQEADQKKATTDQDDINLFKGREKTLQDRAESTGNKLVDLDSKLTKLKKQRKMALEHPKKKAELSSKTQEYKTKKTSLIKPYKEKAMGYATRQQKVKFGSGNANEGKLLRIGDDGKKAWVRVSGGKEVEIQTSQIQNPRKLKSALRTWRNNKKVLKPLKGEVEALKKIVKEGKGLDAEKLEVQLKETQLKRDDINGKNQDAQKKLAALTLTQQNRTSGKNVQDADGVVKTAEKRVEDLERQLGQTENVLNTPETQKLLAQADRDAGVTDHISGGSSGNAAGGMGSVYQELDFLTGAFDSLFAAMDLKDEPNELSEDDQEMADRKGATPGTLAPKPPTISAAPPDGPTISALDGPVTPAGGGDDQSTAGAHVEGLLDEYMDLRPDAEIEKSAQLVAATEEALAFQPTVDIEKMMARREEAVDAMARFSTAHMWAYSAFVAEQELTKTAANTKAYADKANALKKKSQDSRGPIEEGGSKEKQREKVLLGMNANTPESDSKMTGTVMKLVKHLSSNSGEIDGGQPKADANAGKEISDAQTQGGKAARATKADSTNASQQKSKFIADALSVQEAQQSDIEKNQEGLYKQADEEYQLLARVQLQKAEALMARNQAEADFRAKATEFGADATSLEVWATKYRELRGKIDGN